MFAFLSKTSPLGADMLCLLKDFQTLDGQGFWGEIVKSEGLQSLVNERLIPHYGNFIYFWMFTTPFLNN